MKDETFARETELTTAETPAGEAVAKTDFGLVKAVSLAQEMERSYLDYAMSVIVARALPDVRDGLKPVHRRILFAMKGLGLTHGSAYKKCARIVGEVLGKYHPHGDMAVYDALVRLAQYFSMRYPLVDGQGNFGSVDGDPPAAMRYTEARLAAITSEMLYDLDKETVDFIDNFDGTLKEPTFLPAKLPNLLLMGSEGIAVGMATKIPPHNLGEVVDAVIQMLDTAHFPESSEKKDTSLEFNVGLDDIMEHITGPDFPTAGIIYGAADIKQAYQTGRGKILIRCKV